MAKAKPEVKGGARHADLVQALNRVARELSGLGVLFAEAVAHRLGVGRTDLECIDIIAQRGSATAGDLAKATGLTTGAVTGVIDRLEEAGFARRERDPDDRRKVHVRILPKAMARASLYYDALGAALDALAAGYSDAEIALFIDYFTKSRDIIRAEIEKLNARQAPRRAMRALDRLAHEQFWRPIGRPRGFAHEPLLQVRHAGRPRRGRRRAGCAAAGLSLENSRLSPSVTRPISTVSKRRQLW